MKALAVLLATGVLLTACTSGRNPGGYYKDDGPQSGVAVDFSRIPDAVPRPEPVDPARSRPYTVMGHTYHPMHDARGYREIGIASWYGRKFHGLRTATGERYDMYAMTAAHKTLPIPTYVQVTNLNNGKQVIVRVNDRGPFHENRIIDLSYAAASKLGITGTGTGLVELRAIEPGEPTSQPTRIASNPPAATSATPPPATTPHQLYLQLGSFISRDNAESLRARLALNNVTRVAVEESTVDRRPIYRVRIGPLASVAEADQLALKIDHLGIGVPRIVID